MKKLYLLSLIFFVFLASFVLANCCPVAFSGETCIEGLTPSQCKQGYTETSCSLTSGCNQQGCCEINNKCHSQTTKTSCESNGGTFTSGSCSLVESCKPKCCTFGSQCSLKTSSDCENLGGVLDPQISDETTCSRTCSSQKQGCCTDTCTYGSLSSCNDGNFFPNILCSRAGNCKEQCTSHSSSSCGEDGALYWKDSCGNLEEIKDPCDPTGTSGSATVCSPADKDHKEAYCAPVDCSNTWNNLVVDGDGGKRKNGESWCEYQSAVGPGLDLPGSAHFRHLCKQGKEIVEDCGDARDRICVYGDASSLINGEKTSEAHCVENNWQPCLTADTKETCETNGNTCLWLEDNKNLEASQEESGNFQVQLHIYWQSQRRKNTNDPWQDKKGFILPQKEGEENKFEDVEKICDGDKCVSLQILGGAEPISIPFENDERVVRKDDFAPKNPSSPTDETLALRKYSTFTFTFDLPEGDYQLKILNPNSGQVLGVGATGESPEIDLVPLNLHKENLKEINKGKCVPIVAPATLKTDSSLTSSCSIASLQGEKKIKEASYWAQGFAGFGDPECKNGCEIYGRDFILGANSYCNAVGDCGAKYNLLGKFSNEGFTRDCKVGNEYENIQSQCPNDKNKIDSSEIDFTQFTKASSGLKLNELSSPLLETDSRALLGNTRNDVLGAGAFHLLLSLSSGTAAPIYLITNGLLGAFTNSLAGVVHKIVTLYDADEKRDIGSVCSDWTPPAGGSDCNKCNLPQSKGGVLPDNPFSSYDSETGDIPAYRCTPQLCASLGKQCALQQTQEGPKCISSDKMDTHASKIEVSETKYTCKDTCTEEKTDTGFSIVGELKELSGFNLTLKTINPQTQQEEFSTCKYSTNPTAIYPDDYNFYFKEESAAIDHHLEIKTVGDDKSYSFYVVCQDFLGNKNAPYTIKFKAAKQPDQTPPIILNYIPEPGHAYTAFNKETLDLTLKLNEDVLSESGCRWSTTSDTPFENMRGSFHCTLGNLEDEPICKTTLNGITQETNIYFKCRDISGATNTQDQDQEYLVKKSEELGINEIHCIHGEETDCTQQITDPEIKLSFSTSGGAEAGKSICSYQINNGNFIQLLTTGENTHEQPGLTLGQGTFSLHLKCNDLAGNQATATQTLTFKQDTDAPQLLSFSELSGAFNVRTDEASDCSYLSTQDETTFKTMESTDKISHSATSDTGYYKLRCTDKYNHVSGLVNIYLLQK